MHAQGLSQEKHQQACHSIPGPQDPELQTQPTCLSSSHIELFSALPRLMPLVSMSAMAAAVLDRLFRVSSQGGLPTVPVGSVGVGHTAGTRTADKTGGA